MDSGCRGLEVGNREGKGAGCRVKGGGGRWKGESVGGRGKWDGVECGG